MSRYDKFYAYLEELNNNHLHLSGLLQRKLDAAIRHDTDELDAVIKEEQVFVLVSKGVEGNLTRFREQLSLQGETLREIIPELPADERQRFEDIFHKLKLNVEETQTLNLKCQELLEQHLHTIDKALRELDKSRSKTYGKNAGEPGKEPGLFTKSI